MKPIITLLAVIFYSSLIIAQDNSAIITFDKTIHDFEIIKEEQGSVSYSFTFTNTGKSPLIISNIKTPYGCSVSDLNAAPVMPNKKGSINIKYEFDGKPGIFKKQIRITSNSSSPTSFLTIKGEVIAKGKTPDDIFPIKLADLGLRSNIISMNNIYSDQTLSKIVYLYNFSDSELTIEFYKYPKHITFVNQPIVLAPNTEGKVVLKYDASLKNDLGYFRDNFFVKLNNGNISVPNNRLTITANIQQDFSKLTPEQKANAPKIEFEKTKIDFGTVKRNDGKMNLEYKFTNTGKSPLIIHKVSPDCGCTVAEQITEPIAPGESSSIIAVFDTGGRKGNQHKTITIISNDPVNHTIKLEFTGIIEFN